jgi:hypothetical protein
MPRKSERTEFLDPTLLKLERALRFRADQVESTESIAQIKRLAKNEVLASGIGSVGDAAIAGVLAKTIAGELRKIAEELHYQW